MGLGWAPHPIAGGFIRDRRRSRHRHRLYVKKQAETGSDTVTSPGIPGASRG